MSAQPGHALVIAPDAVHVVVDMQRLFAEATEWQVPAIPEILPNVERLVRHRPERTVLTRFVTPASPAAARGAWRPYYERWQSVTLDKMAPERLDLVAPLGGFAPPASVCDKPTYSAFESAEFMACLRRLGGETLIVSGVETDVCVLGTVMAAIDHGYWVVVVADAVTSSSRPSHAAMLAEVYPRFEQQVALANTDQVLAAWPAADAAPVP